MPPEPTHRTRRIGAVLRAVRQAGTREAKATAKQRAAVELGVSVRTIERWLPRFEEKGPQSVTRKRGPKKGSKRVLVSATYDRGVRLPPDTLAEIARELRTFCNSAFNSPLRSRRQVQLAAELWLMRRTREAGVTLADKELRGLCRVPVSFVRRSRHHRVAYIRRNDAAEYAEHYQPRARRVRDGLWFGAVVCIDCTALDILLRRDDGSEYTARVIGFQDLGSNTLFFYVVFPEPGTGVTQAHVAEAFIAWVQRHGVPASVLIDNGPEFRKLDMLDDMMKLAARIGAERLGVHAAADRPDLVKTIHEGLVAARSAIHHARKYNPQSKPIEGQFGNVTRFILPLIKGWIGGDRTRQPTQNQGRRAVHFDGTREQLVEQLNEALRFYDLLPQGGHLAGKSPVEKRADDIAAGFERVDVNVAELQEYWSTEHVCRVRQGDIKIPNLGRYSHARLGALTVGTRVLVRVPLVGGKDRIPVYIEDDDDPFCFAEPVPRYHHLDAAGARYQQARAVAQSTEIAQMDADTVAFDPIEERRQFVAMHPASATATSAGVIEIDKVSRLTAKRRRALPPPAASELPASNAELWSSWGDTVSRKTAAGGADPPAVSPASAKSRRNSNSQR